MCDALRELFAEELEEKREQGWQEGESQGILIGIDLAKKVFQLAKEELSLAEIAEACDITETEVENILK